MTFLDHIAVLAPQERDVLIGGLVGASCKCALELALVPRMGVELHQYPALLVVAEEVLRWMFEGFDWSPITLRIAPLVKEGEPVR